MQRFSELSKTDLQKLATQIKQWAHTLGFQRVGITGTDLSRHETHFLHWLKERRHGEMSYMARHGTRRSRPAQLLPGTIRVISARMDYFPPGGQTPETVLESAELGYISRYALGRDYHKVIRKRLQRLANQIQEAIGPFSYRAFTDSAPVLEKALAENAGLGWIGKHTNLISPDSGSWFFLGELYTDLPLPTDSPTQNHCGSCRSCIDICPTKAITAPYQLDARRCISYHTIELRGTIPIEFRPLIGNRIYGCDDCQLVCPWNKFSNTSKLDDFAIRHKLDAPHLIELFTWSEAQFLTRMAGSAIYRIGYECWLRNIAVALGNAPPTSHDVIAALRSKVNDPSPLVREHVGWALAQHGGCLYPSRTGFPGK